MQTHSASTSYAAEAASVENIIAASHLPFKSSTSLVELYPRPKAGL